MFSLFVCHVFLGPTQQSFSATDEAVEGWVAAKIQCVQELLVRLELRYLKLSSWPMTH